MNSIELAYFKLISCEIELTKFEQFVYSEIELENLLTPTEYLDLISINYQTTLSLAKAEKILSSYFSMSKYYEWSTLYALNKILEKPRNVKKYILQCHDIYCEGLDIMAGVACYGLDLTNNGYSVSQVEGYYPDIEVKAKRIIEWFNSSKIIITGHNSEHCLIEFLDNRTQEEKSFT